MDKIPRGNPEGEAFQTGEEPEQEGHPELAQLHETLRDKGVVGDNWFQGEIIGKETRLGRVDVQFMSEGGFRVVTEPPGELYVEIQVFSPDSIYTRFKLSQNGVEARSQKGTFGASEEIDLQFTLEEVLAELQ